MSDTPPFPKQVDPFDRAVARLRAFAAGFAPGDEVDSVSGLTSHDLAMIVEVMNVFAGMENGSAPGLVRL